MDQGCRSNCGRSGLPPPLPPEILRDRDIRPPLQQWLAARHADEGDTKIIHELEIPRPAARVDLAMINGRLSGYEIKSDADSLSRLQRQVASFSLVFERMTLVTTKKHASHVGRHIPDWWGILVWDAKSFRTKRRGKMNHGLDVERLLHVLTREELLRVETIVAGKQGRVSRCKERQVDDLLQLGRKTTLTRAVRAILKGRVTS